MRTLVIGDIHGCIDELRELVDLAALASGDRIISLGDFVDRGPDSPAVLTFLKNTEGASSLKGNHERKHVLVSRSIVKPALSQRLARAQFDEAGYALALEYFEALPISIELPEAIMVHGFWQAGLTLPEQDPLVLQGTMTGQCRLLQSLKSPWYEAYDGPKPLLVGHSDYLGTGDPLIVKDRVFCLDTGCCRGGRLTGLILPEFRVLSVQSRRDYWSELKKLAASASEREAELARLFRTRQLLKGDMEALTWRDAKSVLEIQEFTPSLSTNEAEGLHRIRLAFEEASAVVPFLLARAERDSKRILQEVYDGIGARVPTDREVGRAFQLRAGDSPYGRLLHRARAGSPQFKDAEQVFRTLSATLRAARNCEADPQ